VEIEAERSIAGDRAAQHRPRLRVVVTERAMARAHLVPDRHVALAPTPADLVTDVVEATVDERATVSLSMPTAPTTSRA